VNSNCEQDYRRFQISNNRTMCQNEITQIQQCSNITLQFLSNYSDTTTNIISTIPEQPVIRINNLTELYSESDLNIEIYFIEEVKNQTVYIMGSRLFRFSNKTNDLAFLDLVLAGKRINKKKGIMDRIEWDS
jgi:hypothetical protein